MRDRARRLLLNHRWRCGRYYVGICTRTQRTAILNNRHGTYCAWHRWKLRHDLRRPIRYDDPDEDY